MSLPEEIVSLVKTKFSIIASLDGQLLLLETPGRIDISHSTQVKKPSMPPTGRATAGGRIEMAPLMLAAISRGSDHPLRIFENDNFVISQEARPEVQGTFWAGQQQTLFLSYAPWLNRRRHGTGDRHNAGLLGRRYLLTAASGQALEHPEG